MTHPDADKNECTCTTENHEPHKCPLVEEIPSKMNEDCPGGMCNCCPKCTHECEMDI